MVENRIIENITINLERLRRQYDINKKIYDKAAMYDLSHILRLWVDMKNDVQLYLEETNPTVRFKTYTINNNLKKLIGSNQHFISGIEGVSTFAGKGEAFAAYSKPPRGSTGRMTVDFLPNNEVMVSGIILINGHTEEELYKKFSKDKNKGLVYKKVKFLEWLGAEAVRIFFINEDNKKIRSIIPREILIKRVANFMGGSHPEGMEATDNQFDEAIKELIKYHIAGLPAPYYILLQAAEDILNNIKLPSK